jgi:hypothetical protein
MKRRNKKLAQKAHFRSNFWSNTTATDKKSSRRRKKKKKRRRKETNVKTLRNAFNQNVQKCFAY